MTALAAKSGLSQQMISYTERGLRTPSIETLLRMADGIGADLPQLLRKALNRAGQGR